MLSTTPAATQSFDGRAEAIINAFAEAELDREIDLFSKYAFWYAQARFQQGGQEHMREALRLVRDGQVHVSTDPSFHYWGNIDCYLRWGDRYPDALKHAVRDNMVGYDGYGGGHTENHRLMLATARYLAAQAWPDARFASGRAEDDPTGEAYLHRQLGRFVARGMIEHDSPVYTAMYLGCLRSLADLSDDPRMRRKAEMVFEWVLINAAGEWLQGHWAAATLRTVNVGHEQGEYLEGDFALWLYFGGAAPVRYAWTENQPIAHNTVQLAVSDYRPPAMIVEIATDRCRPYVHRESHATGDDHWPGYYKTSYLTPGYGVFSQREPFNTPLRWSKQAVRWGVAWLAPPRQDSVFWLTHPRYKWSKRNRGPSAYEEVLQHEGALIAVYDIPDDHRFPYLEGRVPEGIVEHIEHPSGWIGVHGGSVLLGICPLRGYEWGEERSTLFSRSLRNGVIVETASPELFGAQPEEQINRFLGALAENLATVDDLGLENVRPRLAYTALSGDRLEIVFDQQHSINGKPVNLQAWPLIRNPWVDQGIDGRYLTLRRGEVERVYDFKDWTVVERPTAAGTP